MNSTTNIFQLFIYLLRTTVYEGKLERNEYEFRNAMYIMLLKVYLSSFSSVSVCTFVLTHDRPFAKQE